MFLERSRKYLPVILWVSCNNTVFPQREGTLTLESLRGSLGRCEQRCPGCPQKPWKRLYTLSVTTRHIFYRWVWKGGAFGHGLEATEGLDEALPRFKVKSYE